MATLYTHRDSNVRKTWLLMSSFLVLVIAMGWVFTQIYGDVTILYVAVGFSFFMNIFSFWFSDKIVLKMTGAKEAPEEGEYKELHRILENLSIAAGLKKPRLYVIHDQVPNAFATGRNEENAAVAVTTGLLSIMEKSEIEGVLAHELSHIGNKDILVSTIAVMLVGFVALLSDIFLRFSFHKGGDRDNKAGAILMIVGVVLAILAPISASLIQLAISRKREFLADASGALLTRYPEGLASALSKLNSYSGKMKKVSHANAHLFMSDPYGVKAQGFMHNIFATHPPIEDRVAALLNKKEVNS